MSVPILVDSTFPGWKQPAAICTIATAGSLTDLTLWIHSLTLWNSEALRSDALHVYILCDSTIASALCDTVYPWLHIIVGLDMYTGMNRTTMAAKPATHQALLDASRSLWDQLQLEKITVMKAVLDAGRPNVLFTDSDIAFLAPLPTLPCDDFDVLLSPHYIKERDAMRYGFFNGGWVWVNKKEPLDTWYKATFTSRFHEQAALEDVARAYKTACVPITTNFGWWRLSQSDASPQEIAVGFGISADGFITYRGTGPTQGGRLTSIHTHFVGQGDSAIRGFNELILRIMGAPGINPALLLLAEFIKKLK